MRPEPRKRTDIKQLLLVAALVGTSFLVYANTFEGGFVWDDRALFVENYSAWQWENLKQLLTSQDNLFGDRYTGYYRPFPNLTFLLDRQIWDLNPSGYHLTNIIIHILTTLCVYWMAAMLFHNRGAAFFGGLCFALHPVHAEDIAWINGRNNALSTLFFILSFIFYLKHARKDKPSPQYYTLSLLAFLFSLLSKEYALAFPFLLALYECIVQHGSAKERFFRTANRIFPYLIIILTYLAIRSMVLPAHGIKYMNWDTFLPRVLTLPKTFAVYLRLLLFPVDLTVHYETELITSALSPLFWVTLAISLCYISLLYYTYHGFRTSFLALAWIMLTLTPVLNIVPLSDKGTFIAERYLYLPSIGFCIIVGWLLARPWCAWRSSMQRPLNVLLLLFGCFLLQWYLFGTLNRNLEWRNEISLWREATVQTHSSYIPYFNLAVAYRDAEYYTAAVGMFDKAYWTASSPEDRGLVLGNIAYLFYITGQYDRAGLLLKEAVSVSPQNPGIYNLMGNLYFAENDLAEALGNYEKAVNLDPKGKDPLVNIGMTYLKMGEIDSAIKHLENAKALIPGDGRLYYYLGEAYDNKEMIKEAFSNYAIYLKLLPKDSNYERIAGRMKEWKQSRRFGTASMAD